MTAGKTDKWRKGTNYKAYWESGYWQAVEKRMAAAEARMDEEREDGAHTENIPQKNAIRDCNKPQV